MKTNNRVKVYVRTYYHNNIDQGFEACLEIPRNRFSADMGTLYLTPYFLRKFRNVASLCHGDNLYRFSLDDRFGPDSTLDVFLDSPTGCKFFCSSGR